MAYRTEIERALDEMISDETGKKFQGLAVVHAKQKWPQLVACQRNWDGGLDAYANGELDREGRGVGLACSITATPSKVEDDANNAKKNYPDLRVLIFSTPKEVTQHTATIWAKNVVDKYGLQLLVVPREEFITWLMEPANADICRDQLGIAPSMTPELAPAYERAREGAKAVADNWERIFRRTERPLISLNAVKLNEKGDPIETVTTASLGTILYEGQRIVLEASAGSGKTTTLVQLARNTLDTGGLAFLVDLPDWIRSGRDFFSYIADRPQFASRDVDAAVLSKLRVAQPPIFLLNGWNEVPVAGAEAADVALRELDKNFGAAIVVVATRRHSLVPQLLGSVRFTTESSRATAAG